MGDFLPLFEIKEKGNDEAVVLDQWEGKLKWLREGKVAC
jgi:hypothetical protein